MFNVCKFVIDKPEVRKVIYTAMQAAVHIKIYSWVS